MCAQARRSSQFGRHVQCLASIGVVAVIVELIELRGNRAAPAVTGAKFAVDFGFHCFIPGVDLAAIVLSATSAHIFHATGHRQLIDSRKRLECQTITQAFLHQPLEALRQPETGIAARQCGHGGDVACEFHSPAQ